MFRESRGLLYAYSIICLLVLTANEHYINLFVNIILISLYVHVCILNI